MFRNNPIFTEILIALMGLLLFIPFIGGLHLFDWDEINFAESAREMILTGDYLTVQIDFIPFWQKPPLFIWMQVLSMKIFGINEFAARLPNVLCGMLTLVVLFRVGRRLYDSEFGWFWVIAYIGSFLPFLYFKSGIIDPWFNLFIFTAMVNMIYFLEADRGKKKWQNLVLSAVLLGLANLTKGPVSILLFGLTIFIFWSLNKFRLKIFWTEILAFSGILIVVGGAWYLIQIAVGNFSVILDFIRYQIQLMQTQDSGHGGFFLYHFVVLLLGVFPVSIFALKGFRRSYYDSNFQKRFKFWMIVLFWVVLITFTLVKTKIVHYSSLCYFPLSFLGAYVIYKVIHKRIKNYRWLNIIYASVGILIGIIFTLTPVLASRIDWLIELGFFQDPFAQANIMSDVYWSGFEGLIGVLFILGIVASLILLKQDKKIAYVVMFLNVTIFLNLVLFLTAGKIEGYSQKALIEFCEERQGEDCYVSTLGMKSYAHLFYAAKPVPVNVKAQDQAWLAQGDIDKTAYFILRSKTLDYFQENYPELEVIYEKNGFTFCKRDKPDND
ncbi:MAG TPA: glycosyltransferase family 39 protein [Bacteroides sp.]|nr:glycosyltransferase family 39 protein [Bacteroides sp.]